MTLTKKSFDKQMHALGIEMPYAPFVALVESVRHLTPEHVFAVAKAALESPDGIAFRNEQQWVTVVVLDEARVLLYATRGRRPIQMNPPLPRWLEDIVLNADLRRAWVADPPSDAVTGRIVRRTSPPDDGARGAALRAAIVEEPTDTAMRLVYADWLLERGDRLGELIRAHHAGTNTFHLAQQFIPAFTTRYVGVFGHLLDLRSGFVERLYAFAGGLANHPEIFEHEPFRRLQLTASCADDLVALRESCGPHLARITELAFESRPPAARNPRRRTGPARPAIHPSTIISCFTNLRVLNIRSIAEDDAEWIASMRGVCGPVESVRIGLAPRQLFPELGRLSNLRTLEVFGQAWFREDPTGPVALAKLFAELELESIHLQSWHTPAMAEVLDTLLTSRETRIHLARCDHVVTASERVTKEH